MKLLTTAAVAVGCLAFAPAALATDGDLDTSFSTDGKFTFENAGADFDVIDAAPLADGGLAVIGVLPGGANVAVLTKSGVLDTSFGGDGLAVAPGNLIPTEVAVLADGSVVVIGEDPAPGLQLAVARLDPSGAPDASFGGGDGFASGIAGRDFDDLAVDPSGRAVVVGSPNSNGDFELTRLNTSGALDTGFSGDGKLDVNVSPVAAGETGLESANAVAIQPDGKVVVAGAVDVSAANKDGLDPGSSHAIEASFAVIRVTAAGALDTTFAGGTGKSYPNVVTGEVDCQLLNFGFDDVCSNEKESADAVAVEPDGQIAIAGFTDSDADADIDADGATEQQELDFAVAHLNANGSTDTGFSGDGGVSTAIAPNDTSAFPRDDDKAIGVAAGPGGRVVASGKTDTSANGNDFVIVRYLSNGSLDTAFDGASGANGKLKVTVKSPATTIETAKGAALLPNGNVALVGTGDPPSAKNYGAIAVVKNDGIAPDTQIDTGPAESSTVTTTSPVFTFSAVEEPAITTFQCNYGGAHGAIFVDCTSPYTKALADGLHTFKVRAEDPAGNVDPSPAQRTFTVDADPPDTTLTGNPGGYTADTTPTFTFTAAPSGTFQCAVANGHALPDIDDSEFAACSSGFTPAPADGEYTFAVRATNAGGTDPTPAEFEFELDTSAPNGVIVAGPGALTNDRTPTFSVSTDEPFDIPEGEFTMTCSLSGPVSPSAGCTDAPLTFAPSLADGNYTFTLDVEDLLSRLDATPATRQFRVDGTAPATRIVRKPRRRSHRRRAVFRFGGNEAGARFECRLDAARFAACTSPLIKRLKPGRHRFQVRAIDRAGNVDGSPARTRFVILP